MIANIFIEGIIGEDTTLLDVVRQYKSYDNPVSVKAIIHSEGGNVKEGDAIFGYLQSLKEFHPVNTYGKMAYSIAAKILSVGDEIEVDDKDKVVMIHFAWAETKGGAEKFEAVAEYLRGIEADFTEYYSDFLNLDKEAVSRLLYNETFLTGRECVDMGFATKIKADVKAVAKYEYNLNNKQMSKKTKKGFLSFLDAYFNEDTEANALVLQDSNSSEIDFSDLSTGDKPKKGDKATLDGEPVPDGDYIFPSLDNLTVTFSGGYVESVKEEEEEVEVKAEEIKEVMNWTVNVINTSFEVGDIVEYDYEDNSYPVSAGEFELNDGRRIITDASGKIIAIKDAVKKEDVNVESIEGVEAKFEAKFEAHMSKFTKDVKSKVDAIVEAKNTEIKALKAKISGREIIETPVETDKKNPQGNYMAGILRS